MNRSDGLDGIPVPDGYAVTRKLGQGGMGIVYLIKEQRTGEERALKLILPPFAADEAARARFLREVENCRALHHPHVVRTYDSDFAQGMPFLIMEYCDGGSLDRLVPQEGVRPLDEAMDLTFDVLSGLEYAHGAEIPRVRLADGRYDRGIGLVHRDLKPQNIFLVATEGRRIAKIGDFGLAKAFELAGLSEFTRSGDSRGTPTFMPRQQVIDFKYARPEVDVWAAAACLYYLLTGFRPRNFPDGRDRWLVVKDTDPIPILKRGIPLPDRLAAVIDAALMDRPEIGFKTAADLRNALEKAR